MPKREKSSELKRPDFRSRHRLRGHEQAHADAVLATPHEVISHALVSANEPQLITTDQELLALLDELRAVGQFGYDTEFIGEHTYHPKLCVIQVATPRNVILIDPLGKIDLRPFWELLVDGTIEKIVHAGLHDLEPAYRHLQRPPQNIFDTQIAAAFIGLPYPMATSKLIHTLTGADVGKGSKFSQWDQRPLTSLQLHYAGNDVRYLPLMRQVIGERLKAANTERWCLEECQTLSSSEMYAFDAQSQRLRIRGVEALNPQQRATVRALLQWREQIAIAEDVPARSLLRDDVLMLLATTNVESVADLDRIRGLPRPIEQKHGAEIIQLIIQSKVAACPQRDEGDSDGPQRDWYAHRNTIQRLWKQIQEHCQTRGIDPGMAASKRDVTQLVWSVSDGQPLPSINNRLTRGWRWEFLGDVLSAHLQKSAYNNSMLISGESPQ
jgi:ribonuclease D